MTVVEPVHERPARARPSDAHGGAPRRRLIRLTAYPALLLALAAVLVVAMLVAVGIGQVHIPVSVSARVVASHVFPGAVAPADDQVQDLIVWNFRLPRVLLAAIVGGTLALVGAVLQAVVRNQLADPYLLGVSSGASFGAVVVLTLTTASVGDLSMTAAAFGGGVAAVVLVYLIAQRGGHITPARLVLAGVAVGYLFDAAFSYFIVRQPSYSNATNIIFWLMGNLAAADWSTLVIPGSGLAAGAVLLFIRARPLNALLAGDETAASLGIDVKRLRLELVAVAALLTGLMVAVAGAIGFVGLIAPHAMRLIVGTNHRLLLPAVVLAGALVLVLADMVARSVSPDQELPVTAVTAVVGVPFFLWLLRRRRSEEGLQ